MKVLQIDLGVQEYSISHAYWSGGASVKSRLPYRGSVTVKQNIKAVTYPTPWTVRVPTDEEDCLLLFNTCIYPIQVDVNGDFITIQSGERIPVPMQQEMPESFINLCATVAVNDLPAIRKAWNNLALLSWETGTNAFMEVI